MEGLVESIKNNINEARMSTYEVSVSDMSDSQGLPITVTMSVPTGYHKKFEEWVNSMIGNGFMAAQGVNNDWEADMI